MPTLYVKSRGNKFRYLDSVSDCPHCEVRIYRFDKYHKSGSPCPHCGETVYYLYGVSHTGFPPRSDFPVYMGAEDFAAQVLKQMQGDL